MRLIDWLKQNGIRQINFADRVGVSYLTIHKTAHGKSFPQADLARKIHLETAGQVTANDLLNHYLEQAGTPLKSSNDGKNPKR